MKNLMMIGSMILTGCGASIGTGSDASSVTDETLVAATPAPTATPNPEQIRIISASASTANLVSNQNYSLLVLLDDPLSNSHCNWTKTIPPQPLNVGGVAETAFGTVNGNCNAFVHNQYNSLDTNYTVYVNNGKTTTSYSWQLHYVASVAAYVASVVPATPAGTVRVYNTKRFDVTPTDYSGAGTCTWKLDGVTVSTNCQSYTHTQNSATHTLVYTLTNSNNAASVTWTTKPAATLGALSPAASTSTSQTYTATVVDPNASGAICEFKLDGVLAQSRGVCTFAYTRTDSTIHSISVDVVYDTSGTERNSQPATAYSNPPSLHAVAITGVNQTAGIVHATAGQNTLNFGVTSYTDVDNVAWFELYLNGVKSDCGVNTSLCVWTNVGLHNGLYLASYTGAETVVTLKLTNGQYSDSVTWTVRRDAPTIDSYQGGGIHCVNAGTTLSIYGNGFESTDTFTIENQHITLTKVQVSYFSATLQLPAGIIVGSQAIRVTKGSNSAQTGATYVTFTGSSTYCN